MRKSDEDLWMNLTNLFFESGGVQSPEVWDAMAASLKLAKWSKAQTKDVLVGIITPTAKRYLGYGLPLAIGEQIDYLDPNIIVPKYKNSQQLRKKYPRFYFLFQDYINYRILKRLNMDRLLNLLE